MKKLFTLLLTIVLVFSMSTVAFAADTGSITIENAEDGAEYNIYKMLDFAPSNEAGDKGVYTIADNWADFFNEETAKNYFVVVDGTTVVLKDGVTTVDQTLAKAAIAYAKHKNLTATATKKAKATEEGTTIATVKFEGLALGYYAIDTSLGTLCALTKTNTDFVAAEKNEKPDIDKWVQEDRDNSWDKVNDADIDQVVNFKSTITVGLGATNYVMHDTMEEGLTFEYDKDTNNTITVKLDADDSVVDASNYTVEVSPADGHTFDIKFKNDFIAGLAKGTQFTVYYSAILNENAKIVEDGNDNTVYLSYGEDNEWKTNDHTTTTYTWKVDVFKYAKDGENEISLAGAVFEFLDKNGAPIRFTEVAGAAVPTYKVATEGSVTQITTDANGKFEMVGLDEGTYKLHEVTAPKGYNKLTKDVDVVITSKYNTENLKFEYKINESEPKTIGVENKSGGLFPDTGSIGTTIFYVVGSALMLGAVVLFISKKRMATFS